MLPSFDDFTRAVHGRPPFEWQARLARQVLEEGWPSGIGVPTGLGKTSCIDIAVYALAAEARLDPSDRRQPTRIWYVVNRRLLVDEGADRAEQIATLLADPTAERSGEAADVLGAMADLMRQRTSLQGLDGPLHASRLRGGYSGSTLPLSPAQPAVLCATVPMFGSRLLFRGYGTGKYVRSIEAALAGTDSLVLLDEAHLSRPLRSTTQRLVEADAATDHVVASARSAPQIVQLTATGDPVPDRFDLTEQDRTGDSESARTVRRRLEAAKEGRIIAVAQSKLAQELAAQAVRFLVDAQRPIAVAVFVNSPSTAVAAKERVDGELRRAGVTAEVDLITGRMRGVDAERVRQRLLDGSQSLRSGRRRADLERHRVVIATQTLEVGADVDFDALVTQNAGRRALVQRIGRLNRLGEMDQFGEVAQVVIVHPEGAKPDALYGDEPAELFGDLAETETFDLSPGVINMTIGAPTDEGPYAPQLLPNHLDQYTKTSSSSIDQTPVDLFIDGLDDVTNATVEVVWRSHLGPEDTVAEGRPMARELVPPIQDGESVEVPIGALREHLELTAGGDAVVEVVSADCLSTSLVPTVSLRPGAQVVLSLEAGGYQRDLGWRSGSRSKVDDLSWIGASRKGSVTRGFGTLVIVPDVIDSVLAMAGVSETVRRCARSFSAIFTVGGSLPTGALAEISSIVTEQPHDGADRAVVDDIHALASDVAAEFSVDPEEWAVQPELVRRFLAWISTTGVALPSSMQVEWSRANVWTAAAERARRFAWATPLDDGLDLLSAVVDGGLEANRTSDPALLGNHLRMTGERARLFAEEVGLSPSLQLAVANAGRLHDLGKADPRFQRWLGRDEGGGPLRAKSGQTRDSWESRRRLAGWPRGGRHESLSIRAALEIAAQSPEEDLLAPDPDLVLHLVASHHGRGRPGLPMIDDPEGAVFTLKPSDLGLRGAEVEIDGDLSKTDWGQPDRFWSVNQKYGRRGVALLEAVLRQADWAESARIADVVGDGDGVA